MKHFWLVDYKGKFTIIQDELDDLDIEVGKISKKAALDEMYWRVEDSIYYGVPAYVGDDPDLLAEEKKWLDASPNLYRGQ